MRLSCSSHNQTNSAESGRWHCNVLGPLDHPLSSEGVFDSWSMALPRRLRCDQWGRSANTFLRHGHWQSVRHDPYCVRGLLLALHLNRQGLKR